MFRELHSGYASSNISQTPGVSRQTRTTSSSGASSTRVLDRTAPVAAARRIVTRMSDVPAQVAALLREVGETHHQVFRIFDGTDDDWASWYADWLLKLSELPEFLGRRPVRSELVYLLVRLDKDYTNAGPSEPWPNWYATRVIEHFS